MRRFEHDLDICILNKSIQTPKLRHECLYCIKFLTKVCVCTRESHDLKINSENGLLVGGLFWLEIHKNVKNLHSLYARNFFKGSANKNKTFQEDLGSLKKIKFCLFANPRKISWEVIISKYLENFWTFLKGIKELCWDIIKNRIILLLEAAFLFYVEPVFIHMLRIYRCNIYYVTYVTWFILRSVFYLS